MWARFAITIFIIAIVSNDTAYPRADKARRAADPHSVSKTAVNYAKHAVQGYDMRVWISNQMTIGLQAFDGASIPAGLSPRYGLEYPAGSGIEHVYGAGPWIGGIVDGTRRVSEGYNGNSAQKFIRPDPRHPLRELIWQTSVRDSVDEPNRRGCDDDGDGAIDEDDLDGLDNDGDWVLASDDIGADGIEDVNEVGCRGGYDVTDNKDPNFDNYDRAKTDFCRPDANGNYRKQDDPDDPSAAVINPWNNAEWDFLDQTFFDAPRQILLGLKLNWD